MKNIFIYAQKDIKNLVFFDKETKLHILSPNNLPLPNNSNKNTNYLIIDADYAENDLEKIIITYQKYKTICFAFTKDSSKKNILKLYSLGIDNVLSAPININELIQNIITPNKDFNVNFDEQDDNSKKVLIICDNKSNIELLIQTLKSFNFSYTLKTPNDATNIEQNIQKELYDLILYDTPTSNKILNVPKYTEKSKLNKNTPIIFLSNEIENTTNENDNGICYYIQKPYNPSILETLIKNILKIKNLQDKLKRDNNLLENMISNSFSQLIITNANFIVLGCGQQHIQIEENEYIFNVLRKENINFPEEKIRIFSRSSEKTFKFNTKHNNKTFEIIISKVFNEIEFCDKYLIIIEDITEKLLIEEQKETFIATLTHDLKSPIRAEQNILKQMINGSFGELSTTQKTILQEILNSREYENKMIDNLLTRYHSASDSFNLFIEQNSYKDTIKTVLNEISYMFENKNQKITLKYLAQTEEFEYDKTEIKRVLLNLLQNASEYTQKNGEIKLIVEEDNSNIITIVQDNGYGIEKKDLEHIFDKNITLAKKYRKVGAGLGLYICKTLISMHNGNISAKSEPTKGSTFTFILPKQH